MNSTRFDSSPGMRLLMLAAGVSAALAATAALGQSSDALPRTSAGHPDLQGYWTNSTIVPLERPEELGTQAFYTEQEYEARLEESFEIHETEPGTAADVHYQLDDFGLDRSQNPIAHSLRTSIIVDPPDGRLPEPTPEALERREAEAEYRREHGFDSAQDRPLGERCIVWNHQVPPITPVGYNSNVQLMQTADHAVVIAEMIGDARIVPFDDAEPLPEGTSQWLGDSRGRWEGDTLVVETTNFTGETSVARMPLSDEARVVERFTLTDADTIRYEFTVDDPATWTAPWSGEYPMVRIDGPLFEYACHEGNYGIVNTLRGARAEEREAAAGEP